MRKPDQKLSRSFPLPLTLSPLSVMKAYGGVFWCCWQLQGSCLGRSTGDMITQFMDTWQSLLKTHAGSELGKKNTHSGYRNKRLIGKFYFCLSGFICLLSFFSCLAIFHRIVSPVLFCFCFLCISKIKNYISILFSGQCNKESIHVSNM